LQKSLGLALGSGGARGLAHIAILEAIDELNVDVHAISGTSIGAIIGTLYAAGLSGRDIRQAVDSWLAMPGSISEARQAKRTFGWLEFFSLQLKRSHFLHVDALVAELESLLNVVNLEELPIPTKVVAADFYQRKEVVFDSGPIIPALMASFCLPGIFEPVVIDNTILVDGGSVNPVPFDLIHDECDIVVGIDVLGVRMPKEASMPTFIEAIFNTFQISSKAISDLKQKSHPPDLYIEPLITDVRVLEFNKAKFIYEQAQPECDRLKQELPKLLESSS